MNELLATILILLSGSFLATLILSGRIAIEPVAVRKASLGAIVSKGDEYVREDDAPRIERAFFERDSRFHWRWILGSLLGLMFATFLMPIIIGVFAAWILLHVVYQFRVLRSICARSLRRAHAPMPDMLALPVALLQFIPREVKTRQIIKSHNKAR